MDKKESKRIDRYAQFAVAAAKMAIEDAKLDLEAEDRERIGTYVGSGIGGDEECHFAALLFPYYLEWFVA